MGSKMLIDAAHPEETRVVSARGKRLEEFDYESAHSKQLKGNIYLAKVTRVEPSLQAAFVDYGGNRHGFLSFSEIHPDYYQLPIADRQALLRQEEDDARASNRDFDDDDDSEDAADGDDDEAQASNDQADDDDSDSDEPTGKIDTVGEEDALEEVPQPRRTRRKSYKIQEVIKRRQIILVQVVKEERGNKGAALTTYLSMAGRYCVLMPNTARGGGISRKITDSKDRKRLKEVARNIEVPEGMGLIVRTAGAQRNKAEIRRDCDYLLRLWENVRDLTLDSTAPSLVYEEGSLIKRSIRDLYNKDVDEVLVEGEEAYKEAKTFMKMLMPSHARNVKLYKDTKPLFARFQIEGQLDQLYSPTVTLPSGGYLVINQTEALVAIDINSGKATREHSIEDTAVKTNLEAADEIARQLRLRDLAGLIVIDFIDMEERRNNRAVERRVKEALKNDRARIQVGRISHFGLLEMSRQRLRQSMLEGTTKPCPHCEGTGLIRSIGNCALSVLRAIDDRLMTKKSENLDVKCHPDVVYYILNEKREHILALEENYGVSVFIQPDNELGRVENRIERSTARAAPKARQQKAGVSLETAYESSDDETPNEDDAPATTNQGVGSQDDEQREGGKKRRRRRGRRGGRRGRDRDGNQAENNADEHRDSTENTGEDTVAATQNNATESTDSEDNGEERRPRRTRGGRGRKRVSSDVPEIVEITEPTEATAPDETASNDAVETANTDTQDTAPEDKPKRKPRKRPAKKAAKKSAAVTADSSEVESETVAEEKPKRKPRKRAAKKAVAAETATEKTATEETTEKPVEKPAEKPAEPIAEAVEEASTWQPPQQTAPVDVPKKRGWWRRG